MLLLNLTLKASFGQATSPCGDLLILWLSKIDPIGGFKNGWWPFAGQYLAWMQQEMSAAAGTTDDLGHDIGWNALHSLRETFRIGQLMVDAVSD